MDTLRDNNNNNKCSCIAPQVRKFRGAGTRQCVTEKREERARENRNVFSLDLNTVTESLLTTVFGNDFQTARAEHW